MLGLGKNLSELKSRIQKIQKELEQIGVLQEPRPEVIEMTNLLRSNEYLTKADEKKSELILAYGVYTKQLEQVISSMLSIQADLKDVVKAQASIIGKRKKPQKRRTAKKRKTTKKRKTNKKRKKIKKRKR